MTDPQEFIQHLKEVATKIFVKQKGLNPMALVLCRRDPKTRLTLKTPRIAVVITEGVDDERAKDAYAAAVTSTAKKGEALAVGTIAEAWLAKGNDGVAWARQSGANTFPGRLEVVVVGYQHRDLGTGCLWAEIIRTPGQQPVLGPWSADHHEKGDVVGRLAELLPQGIG